MQRMVIRCPSIDLVIPYLIQGEHILEKSLNSSENYGGSLKSPWILKMFFGKVFSLSSDILENHGKVLAFSLNYP